MDESARWRMGDDLINERVRRASSEDRIQDEAGGPSGGRSVSAGWDDTDTKTEVR